MGNNQMQTQYPHHTQASKTTVQQAIMMFRDQIGTVLSATERLLYSLGKISHPNEFKFHSYSPERLVECDSNQAAHKLFLVYKYLASYSADMQAEFPDEVHTIQKLHEEFNLTFQTSADNYFGVADTLGPEHQMEQRLLQKVLTRIYNGDYRPLDANFAAEVKNEIKRRSGPEIRNSHDHSPVIIIIHHTNMNLDDTGEYMNKYPNKQPNSGYEPVTRVSSTQLNTEVNFTGGNSHQHQGAWNDQANHSGFACTHQAQCPVCSGRTGVGNFGSAGFYDQRASSVIRSTGSKFIGGNTTDFYGTRDDSGTTLKGHTSQLITKSKTHGSVMKTVSGVKQDK